jgi:hypothetical protein
MSNRHLPLIRSLDRAEENVTSVGIGNSHARVGGAHRVTNPILHQEGSTEAGIGSSVSYFGESHFGAPLTNDTPS